MKIASYVWILSSLLINLVIGFYLYLRKDLPVNTEDAYDYINQHWAAFGGHWKIEFIVMTAMFVAAMYFALRFKTIAWVVITGGLIITLGTYPIMLGGYYNTAPQIMDAANQMATSIFTMGSFVFFLGITLLYLQTRLLKKLLRNGVTILAAITAIGFLLVFLEILRWGQMAVFGPIANILYLFNAWYGWKLYRADQRQSDAGAYRPLEVQLSPQIES